MADRDRAVGREAAPLRQAEVGRGPERRPGPDEEAAPESDREVSHHDADAAVPRHKGAAHSKVPLEQLALEQA